MRLAALALAVGLLAGCTSGDDSTAYDADDYRSGDCAATTPLVFSIQADADDVVEGDAKPEQVVADLKAQQADLISALRSVTEVPVKDSAQKVVDAVGFLRIGLDAQTFTPKLAADVAASARRHLAACSVN